jgi:hypothetical protein
METPPKTPSDTQTKPSTVKMLSEKIWHDVSTVDIHSAEELKSGVPFVAIINTYVRDIMVQTIRGCADIVDAHPSGVYNSVKVDLNIIADRVSKTRFHLLYTDLKEHSDAS